MKKNLYLLVLIFGLLCQPVLAKTVAVEALNDFSTENPSARMSVKILEDLAIDDNVVFSEGTVVDGKVVDVTDPKRLKRDATFTFVPLSYVDKNGKTIDVKGYYPAKYTTKISKGELAKNVGLGVGNFFVKGLSLGYSAVEGAVKNEKDNRFKSSVTEVYKDSPLSYVEKGGEIAIEKHQLFYLNFKSKEDEDNADLPNYEYTPLQSE